MQQSLIMELKRDIYKKFYIKKKTLVMFDFNLAKTLQMY